ncbi:acetaldehyde dehydrogenase (acetylating) [Paraburkholderia caribensis]|uniref:acetaldehyde dehydrogenase (acetylating) n=1 Tax=Paraburkholderia caribensis TaxID=75105 RepID=UPI001CB45526|nr:acetaldehyde dehydrogenase (acetylating) [Paraburkholderia caribensis]CAG9263096.1 acetaldehyde dehydrogenase (acylating) [Paraburkholderia caribensis]
MDTTVRNTQKVAIIGSGNIGTDLMIKILRGGKNIEVAALVGIDPTSEGLARARRFGVPATADGIEGLVDMPRFGDIRIAFDATTAGAHLRHSDFLQQHGIRVIDLTPAAVGPYVIPVINLQEHLDSPNVNMVTCGGQATIPVVAAVSRVAPVHYAEIVASISSRSAGPGTRANIDEFTETTSRAICTVGGAARGKAIIILNPAEPPLIMRDTVFTLSDDCDTDEVEASVYAMMQAVQAYVPGYRLKQRVQFERISSENALPIPGLGRKPGLKTTVFLEVEGAGHYLPAYAGNLDIMTSAALACAEAFADRAARAQGGEVQHAQ